jgi:arylsulfatase A-like enzyme
MVLLMQKLIKFMMIVIASMAADGLMRWWSDGWADGGADNPLMISSSWQIQQIFPNV